MSLQVAGSANNNAKKMEKRKDVNEKTEEKRIQGTEDEIPNPKLHLVLSEEMKNRQKKINKERKERDKEWTPNNLS